MQIQAAVVHCSVINFLSCAVRNSFQQIALNLALPVIYKYDFMLPMLPAPLQVPLVLCFAFPSYFCDDFSVSKWSICVVQVIARHSAESVATSLDQEDTDEESSEETIGFASISTAAYKMVEIGRSQLDNLVSRARVLLSSISSSALAEEDSGDAEGDEGEVHDDVENEIVEDEDEEKSTGNEEGGPKFGTDEEEIDLD